MTLVERLREKANMYVEDIMDEAADRIEALEAALREIAAKHPYPTEMKDIARKALGEGKP